MQHNVRMKRLGWIASGLFALFVVWAALPYWLPPTIALGPCGKDWTSPSSFMPRASPMRSARLSVGEASGKLCYGSPSARGRPVFGALVPWGELWRTGANEPTRLFLDGPLVVAGIALEAGRYSIYTIPGPDSWQLFISRSTFHWGNQISPEVRALEVGETDLPSVPTEHVEEMTFGWSGSGESGTLALEWETTRLEIPVVSRTNR